MKFLKLESLQANIWAFLQFYQQIMLHSNRVGFLFSCLPFEKDVSINNPSYFEKKVQYLSCSNHRIINHAELKF